MSLPSDTNPDVAEAAERMERPRVPRRPPAGLTADQRGWAFAAFVAFLGITYFGPALARYRRRPPLKERLSRRAESLRREARARGDKAAGKLRKHARRLGGGGFWR